MNEKNINKSQTTLPFQTEDAETTHSIDTAQSAQNGQTTASAPTASVNPNDKIIHDVIQNAYEINRTVLTEDDPFTAVLVAQRLYFNRAITALQADNLRQKKIFIERFKEQADKVMQAVDKTERLRKEMIIELLSAHQTTADEAEKRIYTGLTTRYEQTIQQMAMEQNTLSIKLKYLTAAVVLVLFLELILLVTR